MFDFRYHIVSLVAVFMALTLGIVLGSSIAEKGVIEEGRKAAFDKLVLSIKGDIADLQQENTNLKADLRQFNILSQGTYQALTAGKLLGKNYLIISSNDAGTTVSKAVKKAVEDAGGKTYEFRYLGVGDKPIYAEISKVLPGITLGSGDIDATVRSALMSQLQASADPKFIEVLVKNKVIELDENIVTPINGLILDWHMSKGATTLSSSDLALIETFQNAGEPVVGVELSGTKASLVPVYSEFKIDTVDNVDKVSGKLSLVYVLLGRSGHFGEGRTAQSLLPPLATSEPELQQ